MQSPPFRRARLPALTSFICQFWSQPLAISQPIPLEEVK